MLKEIYIDNYKTFVNFRLNLDSFQLFLGENGSGKTSVFEVLSLLKEVMAGAGVGEKFDENTLTAWNNNTEQKFELVMEIDNELYQYTLLTERRKRDGSVIKHEELRWNNKRFYYFDGNEVHLFRINGNTKEPEEGTSFPGERLFENSYLRKFILLLYFLKKMQKEQTYERRDSRGLSVGHE